MRQHEMVRRDMSSVQYSRGRAAVRYKHPAMVVDMRYLPCSEQVRRHRKPVPEWIKILGFCVLRIMPPLLLAAAVVVLVCTAIT